MAGDPPGARLAFYIFGDTGACVRFLVVVVVVVACLVILALVSPALAGTVASVLAGALGGRAALRWWRSLPRDGHGPDRT